MTTINISLPDEMKDYVNGAVSNRKYGTVSEYVRHLIRSDEMSQTEVWLANELKKGMEGPFYELKDDTIWNWIVDETK